MRRRRKSYKQRKFLRSDHPVISNKASWERASWERAPVHKDTTTFARNPSCL